MKKLQVDELHSLEDYHKIRDEFRTRVLQHKRNRQVALGPNATLYFEDRLTMQYQVQEMLRIERIFEAEAIEEELSAYNPLIPDGSNLKATFMIEFPDVEERRRALERLGGIEDQVYVQVQGFDRVVGFADEDLERSSEEGKTSAVHFMRFELTPEMVAALKDGAALGMGVTHPNYTQQIEAVDDAVRQALVADLD